MSKSISVERLYFLGNFQNIKFKLDVDGIPEDLGNDNTFMDRLHLLSLITMEMNFRNYIKLISDVPHHMDNDEALAALENIRTQLYQTITGE